MPNYSAQFALGMSKSCASCWNNESKRGQSSLSTLFPLFDLISLQWLGHCAFNPKALVIAYESPSSVCLARMLRGCGCCESEPAFPDQHQIANVNERVRQISQNANRISSENEVKAHNYAACDAPVPERYWNHTFALPLRGHPLDKETHREKSVPDKAEDH